MTSVRRHTMPLRLQQKQVCVEPRPSLRLSSQHDATRTTGCYRSICVARARPQQQTMPHGAVDQWDGRTDGQTHVRYIDPASHTARSVNNVQHFLILK